MSFLPGKETICNEILVVCALAQTAFVSKHNFSALPHLSLLFENRSKQAVIESLLSIAIKTRFLDDQINLLRANERKNPLIGRYFEDGVEQPQSVSIRYALNKLVHHKTIALAIKPWTCFVVDVDPTPHAGGPHIVELGSHSGERVTITVSGRHEKKEWRFDIDLYKLLEEVLVVLAIET